ncbi:hypothetical protein [Aliiroseovarius sp. F47248L]|uniref:hypothetical protein n=1 Tax=Aliiroseovarius sp. F47248L TaxID=2926420 RepID=UPI001FF54C1E|nr:hypothetical protein [Aliiroseovarius sp. F47248L]MCK0140020.1 hypothetical protein [Aliiroseovarius sp. F47248L]
MEAAAHCDICGQVTGLVEPHSSGMAPVSYVACVECRARRAEAIGVVCVWIATYGGLDATPDYRVKLVSHFDGSYKEWQHIRDYYIQNEEEVLSWFSESRSD